MPCGNISNFISRTRNRFLETLGLTGKPAPKELVISSPFDFQHGPAMSFPGYSQDDISLLKEKALASAAMNPNAKSPTTNVSTPTLDDLEFDFASRPPSRPRSRAESARCGLGRRVVFHARKVSRGVLV
ncbi:uncharacterized protein BP5553_10123 [Venustampulla echinocandica]|uniref:Uncharacterized protein n=1 Tax=Venustampulla echinocandica TaxID=2656787 RepID=A0A370TAE0_9HELO|nr:uncharacterized protein BP5553_10123 [Venustampulla echinocandica]RDL30778.1 hypothetical protein BP5553_10123 [Venustampulla echinocandica]